MLPFEIESFADQQIEELEAVARLLREIQSDNEGGIPDIHLAYAMVRIANAQHALRRFKVCMTDEVHQKNKYRKKYLNLRLETER